MIRNITFSNDKLGCGNLILVNNEFPVRQIEEEQLTPAMADAPDILIRREAANILQVIFNKIGCVNEIVTVSGYRSSKEQTEIYNSSLRESGEEFTKKFVAIPYHSEHQTGLAIDLGLRKDNIDFICPDFPYKGICEKFRNKAPYYGFIERYPKGKEQITGIAHEPWHFRYVGYPHSRIIAEMCLTLEEYIDFIKKYTVDNGTLKVKNGEHGIDIFYTAASKDDSTTIHMPENSVYQVSGNNADGFIITVWR